MLEPQLKETLFACDLDLALHLFEQLLLVFKRLLGLYRRCVLGKSHQIYLSLDLLGNVRAFCTCLSSETCRRCAAALMPFHPN
jgi:hypothetical protein